MIGWVFQSLPSAIFELFFYAGLAGLLLLLADRGQKFLCREVKILLLSAFVGMCLWRLWGGRGSSRYSNLLIPPSLLFSAVFCVQLIEWVPARFRKIFAVVLFGSIFICCTAKVILQYDPYRIRLFRSIAGCVRQEQGRVRLASDLRDHPRLAGYAGIPESLLISRENRSREATLKALSPLRNRDGVFYVVLQDPLNSQPLGDEMLQRPGETWQFCGEFIKNRHRKYILRVYRFQPAPHWEKGTVPIPRSEGVQPLFRDDFESAAPAETATNPNLIFPPGWGINGIPNPDVRIFPETAKPISGAGSLTVRASIVEFLPKQYFPAKGDCILRFLARGSKGCSLLVRMFVFQPQSGNKTIDLDKFFFEDDDLHECRIPISFHNVSAKSLFRIAFRFYDGTVTLDDLQLIPVTRQVADAEREKTSRGDALNPQDAKHNSDTVEKI